MSVRKESGAKMLRIGVYASGGGTNLQSLIDACKEGSLNGKVAAVISNNSKAHVLIRAANENIPSYHLSGKTHPEKGSLAKRMLEVFEENGTNLIILAGYMKLLPPEITKRYRDRILNVHPALLPKYGGKGMYGQNVHKAVIEAGERISGATVHFVDDVYDHGAILIQRTVPVMADDTPESLAARVLKVEHKILPMAAGIFLC
ncbi:MAG: phosphoribosylglycinamide formyltransferase [candidate division Zixibacteria bacterium]